MRQHSSASWNGLNSILFPYILNLTNVHCQRRDFSNYFFTYKNREWIVLPRNLINLKLYYAKMSSEIQNGLKPYPGNYINRSLYPVSKKQYVMNIWLNQTRSWRLNCSYTHVSIFNFQIRSRLLDIMHAVTQHRQNTLHFTIYDWYKIRKMFINVTCVHLHTWITHVIQILPDPAHWTYQSLKNIYIIWTHKVTWNELFTNIQ